MSAGAHLPTHLHAPLTQTQQTKMQAKHDNLNMIMHADHLSTGEAEAKGSLVQRTLCYVVSLKPAWAK